MDGISHWLSQATVLVTPVPSPNTSSLPNSNNDNNCLRAAMDSCAGHAPPNPGGAIFLDCLWVMPPEVWDTAHLQNPVSSSFRLRGTEAT